VKVSLNTKLLTKIETKVQCDVRPQTDGSLNPVIEGGSLTSNEQSTPIKPGEQLHIELLQIPCAEHCGCPGQMFAITCVSITDIFTEKMLMSIELLKVLIAVSIETLSDCSTLNTHSSLKLLNTPVVAISATPVKAKSSMQSPVISSRDVVANC
jgi:hypothetical protein